MWQVDHGSNKPALEKWALNHWYWTGIRWCLMVDFCEPIINFWVPQEQTIFIAPPKNSMMRDHSRDWNLDVVWSWKNRGVWKEESAAIFGRNRGKGGEASLLTLLLRSLERGSLNLWRMDSAPNFTHSYKAISSRVTVNFSTEALKHWFIYLFIYLRTLAYLCHIFYFVFGFLRVL